MRTQADKNRARPAAAGAATTAQRQVAGLPAAPGNSLQSRQLQASQDLLDGSPQAARLNAIQMQAQPNRTGLPDQLKAGIEHLSGMAMDGVRVHYNSARPAQLQAHAYAQGNDIHLGPGQEKHLPHEAWHVVQQKQGRVRATMQMQMGVAINDDAGLEREADVMGGRATGLVAQARHVSHETAPLACGGQAAGAVLQCQFTVDALVSAEAETTYPERSMYVNRINMAEKARPDTQFGTLQKSHAVAWTGMFDMWRSDFKGPYAEVRQRLISMAKRDHASDANAESRALREHAVAQLDGLDGTMLTVAEWGRRVSQAVRFYIEAYQKSSFSTHAKKPGGRGEGHAKSVLGNLNHAAEFVDEEDVMRDATGDGLLKQAEKLIDVSFSLPPQVFCKSYDEWLRMIPENYPHIADEFVLAAIKKVNNKELSPGLKKMFPSMRTLGELLLAWKQNPASQQETISAPTTDKPEGDGFIVSMDVVALNETQYPLDRVQVDAIALSELDRPDTQFGSKQMSHAVAWTAKVAQWQREFRGPLRAVLEKLLVAAEHDHGGDLNAKSRELRHAGLAPLSAYLEQVPAPRTTLSVWRNLLCQAVTVYVETYQMASTTTHGETPGGRGEAAAKAYLVHLDGLVACNASATTLPDGSNVVARALQLIDAPLTKPVDLVCKAYEDWEAMLKVLYPHAFAHYKSDFSDYLQSLMLPSTSALGGQVSLAASLANRQSAVTSRSLHLSNGPAAAYRREVLPGHLEPSQLQRNYLDAHGLSLVAINNDGDCLYNATRQAGVAQSVQELRDQVAQQLQDEGNVADADSVQEGGWVGDGADNAPRIFASQHALQYHIIHPNAYVEQVGNGATVITLVLIAGPPQHYHLAR